MQSKQKTKNTNISIYQNWISQNGILNGVPGIEYFGTQTTFTEIDKMIDVYARAFKVLRNKKDSSVTICSLLIPSTIYALYALNKLGIRVNFVSYELLNSDGKEYINNNDTETLILLDRFYPGVAEELSKTNLKNVIVAALGNDTNEQVSQLLGGTDFLKQVKGLHRNIDFISLDDFVTEGKSRAENITPIYNSGETAVILYTGGSTGIPKGVEITNEGLAKMYNVCVEQGYDYEIGDRNLCLIPPNHPTSFVHCLVNPWLWGITQVLQPVYNKYTFAKDIRDLRVQYAMAAPSHYQTLLLSDIKGGEFNHVKRLFTGGEPMTKETAESLVKVLTKAGVQNPWAALGYGMSELGPLALFTFHLPGLLNKVGQTVPGVKARIVDDNGIVLGDNQRGNLEIKTPCRMKGYFKKPELTAEFFKEDGFAITGDIAIRDEEGNYNVLGRASDSFIAPDGKKIYMFDIENFVYQDPAVMEAEVIKLPVEDGVSEYIPLVHIVLQPEFSAQESEVIARINKKCNEQFEGYSIPRGYKVRKEFGTNPISTKRDYLSLVNDREGYYRLTDFGLATVTFPEVGIEQLTLIDDLTITPNARKFSFITKTLKSHKDQASNQSSKKKRRI
ncbi:MAG: acyl--CoA ligase [Clostridiales bacterium]|jgi:acyl-coenzyme A synthetase/AMP-(fatty) acid ligase|nr:acyl--CoA ligase [Clostridiales bacterium]